MASDISRCISYITIVLACIAIAGCSGGAKIRENEDALAIVEPLTTAKDDQIEVNLDWVIVRNGPGSWSEDADWDEYLLRVTNNSESNMRINSVYVYDSLSTALRTNGERPELVNQSKKSKKRYKDQGLTVKAGVSGEALMVTGAAVYVAGTATGFAVFTGGLAATAAATGVAVGAVVIAPVLVIAGSLRINNASKVASVINERQTKLPIMLAAGETQHMDLFFPLAPSPIRVEIEYRSNAGEHRLSVDTREILKGIHIEASQDRSE